jgi:MFS family permease
MDGRVLRAVWFVSLPALLFGTLGVLASLRLDTLGFGAAAIGATFLTAAAFEAVLSPVLGHLSDTRGRLLLIRASLVASAVVAALLPWPDHRWLLAPLVVLAGIAYGSFWSPAMSHLTDVADSRGLDYGYGFALINIAWAPGQALGAAGGGALARATADAVPYLLLAGACVATLLLVRQLRA